MPVLAVVAEQRDRPAEGTHIVSEAIILGLRNSGYEIELVEPRKLSVAIMRWVVKPPDGVLFTHGPGCRTVAASALIRHLVRTKIVWVATRPDLIRVPTWLRFRNTAHGVVCNRTRADLQGVAKDAIFIEQFIGIDPKRVAADGRNGDPWPELTRSGRLIVLHLGHLKPNRGLDTLAAAQRVLANKIEVVVQASPTFSPDPRVLADLLASGVTVRQGFEPTLGSLYRAADLYVFPTRPQSEGAIELPLGVLEAVASGTPVLTTPFGALQSALAGVPGVTFADEDSFIQTLQRLACSSGPLDRPTSLPSRLEIGRAVDATRTLLEALCNKSL